MNFQVLFPAPIITWPGYSFLLTVGFTVSLLLMGHINSVNSTEKQCPSRSAPALVLSQTRSFLAQVLLAHLQSSN